jgi:hypothetical protein
VLSVGWHQFLQTFAPASDRLQPLVMPAAAQVPQLLWTFWTGVYAMLGFREVLVTVLLWGLAIGLAFATRRSNQVVACFAALVVAAVAYGSIMAIFLQGLDRHFMAAFPVCVAAPLAVIATNAPRWATISSTARKGLHRAAPALAIVWVVAETGWRQPGAVRRALIADLGMGYEVPVYTRRVAAVTGDYWSVWPIVFAANLLHERDTGLRPVVPVTFRSHPMSAPRAGLFQDGALVAVVPPGATAFWELARFPALSLVSRHESYDIATTASATSRIWE